MFSRFTHVSTCIFIFFFFVAEKYSIIWIYYIVFIFSSVDRHLGSFYFVPIINNVANNIYVQVLNGHIFSFLLYT